MFSSMYMHDFLNSDAGMKTKSREACILSVSVGVTIGHFCKKNSARFCFLFFPRGKPGETVAALRW